MNTIYVFVRRDLSRPQQVVQAGHALIESQKGSPFQGEHPYVICLGCKTEKSLKNALDKIRNSGIICYEFNEPDRNNELTAFATECLEERKEIFKKFNLLT